MKPYADKSEIAREIPYVEDLEKKLQESEEKNSQWLRRVGFYTKEILQYVTIAKPDKDYVKEKVVPLLKKADRIIRESDITGNSAKHKEYQAYVIRWRAKFLKAYIRGEMPPRFILRYKYLSKKEADEERKINRGMRKIWRRIKRGEPKNISSLVISSTALKGWASSIK